MVLELVAVGFFLAAAISFYLFIRYRRLYREERSAKMSAAVKHGKTFEQLIPLSEGFPGNPRGFRFLGDPIDGILFEEDGVTFIEFKTGGSALTEGQKKIKSLIEDNKVEWKEIRTDV